MPESALIDDEALDLVREEADLLKTNRIELTPDSRRGSLTAAAVEETWEQAVKTGEIGTNWKYEAMVLARYSVLPNSLPLYQLMVH